MTSTDLDPRFDPRYQRGYDAEQHRPVVPTVAPGVVAAFAPLDAPKAEDVEPVEFPDEFPADFLDEPDEPVRRLNPYLIALIALPLLLLGAGAYSMVWYASKMSEMYASNGYGYDYLAATVVPMIAPALIVTGFASLIAVLTQFALSRGRRG